MNKAQGKVDQSFGGAILSDSFRKKLDEFGSELAGFIFTREHHHLTQIFGWPLQAT